MNKYTELSDFEINKAVFHKAKIKHKYFRFLPNGVITYNIKGKYQVFDPCNNPFDAMPIIIENNISLRAPTITDRWKAEFIDEYGNYVGYRRALNKNPLRAAMELFLLMKDAENENNNNS
ncbi:phage protein NinX family protein [Providencia sp. PROV063]|uniref:phage protein NinX family protein n=1 Tax=Providencia sp. PROV063 TaxID=2949789 RepID=UPI00234ADD8F|nr:phage protein NinX family protein [Providencia sp. PROV063]